MNGERREVVDDIFDVVLICVFFYLYLKNLTMEGVWIMWGHTNFQPDTFIANFC